MFTFGIFRNLLTVALTGLLCLLLFSCSENTPVQINDPDIFGPSNLRAYSDNGIIGLLWFASTSESQDNFDFYRITVTNKSDYSVRTVDLPKGTTTHQISGLKNGIRFAIVIHAITTLGKKSVDSAKIEWASALRYTVDSKGNPIRVYATTSSNLSGIDIQNASGKTELLDVSSAEFASCGDFFIHASDANSPLEIVSPDKYAQNPGLVTQFSTTPAYEVDNLDAHYTTVAPAAFTYTLNSITILDIVVAKSRVYYGRLKRSVENYYFRMLVKRNPEGQLIHGSGNDRYLELEISFQDTPNVPFAKQ